MRKLFLIFLFLFLINSASAEIIIYDNITTSQYKFIKIIDDSNIKILNEYKYEILINGLYYGTFEKDEIIQIPDNSNITILITQESIELNQKLYQRAKENIILIIGILISLSAVLFIGYVIINMIRRKR